MSEFAFFAVITGVVLILCVIWLVRSARRPVTDEHGPDDVVHLTEARDELEAKVLASKVQAFGIPTFVRNRLGPILYGFPPSFVGWEVLVRHGDLDEARLLLGIQTDRAAAEEHVEA